MINFLINLQTEDHSFSETSKTATTKEKIPTSHDITGIEIRLNNITIKDNKTPKVFPFPGMAKVYLICAVIADNQLQPISFELTGFEKVDDGDVLNIDRVIYFWKDSGKKSIPPSQIHVFTSLIKSKESLREAGKVLTDIKNDKKFKLLQDELNQILANSPSSINISNLVFSLAAIMGSYLGKVEDKPLLSWIQSFTDINGDFDELGALEKRADNKFASMKLNITVRDKKRKSKKTSS